MSESSQHKTESVKRIVAAIGCLFFVILAIKMGVESLRARSTHELMSNWKNGKMTYEDGFKLTGIFVLFAVVWGYYAVRPKSVAQTRNRAKK
ncbi:MAG TPA: hypothetical protein VNV15_09495 [Opitutaceae bacterium]|jgi:hypothetical protein|nr:hypothetical protein [Opitutaceae bacterium]